LNAPDRRTGPLEGPVPPLQGRRLLDRVPGAPPVRARDVSPDRSVPLLWSTLLQSEAGEPPFSVRRDLEAWDPFEVLRVPREHRELFLECHPRDLRVHWVQHRPPAKERSCKPARPRAMRAVERPP